METPPRRLLVMVAVPDLGVFEAELPVNASMERVAGMMASAVEKMSIRYGSTHKEFLKHVAGHLVDMILEDSRG